MSTVRVLDYRTQIERQQTNRINKTPMSTTPLHKKINEKHKDTDDRRQTASLQNTDEHKTTSHKLHAKKKNLVTRWTSVLVCILSASLPRFVRVTSALRRKLDRIKNNLYNAIQAPRSRVSAVLRRLHMRSKGISQSVFSVNNALRCARRLVMTTLKTSHGRPLMAVFATTLLVAAAILAGCGSGGSGDTPVPPPPPITPTPVNAVMTTSVTPADGATSVARDTKLTAVFTANTGTFASTTASLSCGGVSQTITASMPVASGKMTTVTWAAASPLPYSATCTYQVLGTAAGVDGGAQANTNTRGTFTVEQLVCKTGEAVSADGQTCVAVASWWPPKNVAPIGVKTYNPGVFPMDGLLSPEVGGVIWQKAVIDGTIKFAETGMILTGFSPEPLLLAFFLNPYLKNVCTTLVYKKNGASIYPDKRTYGGCKTDVFDWIVGTTDGYISHFLTADLGRKTNVCYKESWDGVNQRGVATEVTCP